MTEALDRVGLDELPQGSKVIDRDGDKYVKLASGRWEHFENVHGAVAQRRNGEDYGVSGSDWLAHYKPVLLVDDWAPEADTAVESAPTGPVTPGDVVRARQAFTMEMDGMDTFDMFDHLAEAGYFTDNFYRTFGLSDDVD